MVSFTQPFSLVAQQTAQLVQAPLGAYIANNWTNEAGDSWGSNNAHWTGYVAAMGRTASVVGGAIGTNPNTAASNLPAFATWSNDNWPTSIVSGSPASKNNVWPLIVWLFTNGPTNNDFAEYASGTFDTFIQSALQTWFNNGWRRIYIRANWEFNQNFVGMGLANAGDLVNWIACWKHFCNVCHTKGKAIGLSVRICWSPAISNLADSGAFGLSVYSFFPQPDSNAVAGGDGVTKRYVDCIAPDVYAFGGDSSKSFDYVDPVGWQTGTIWCFDTCAKIAQSWGISVGIPELGDFSGSSQIAYQDWIPNHFVTYMNNLKNWTPPVPIEFIMPYDLTQSGAFQFSDGQYPNELLAWRRCIGLGAASSIPIMTTAT